MAFFGILFCIKRIKRRCQIKIRKFILNFLKKSFLNTGVRFTHPTFSDGFGNTQKIIFAFLVLGGLNFFQNYLAEICSELLEFKVINQKLNWIGFLSRKFDCQQCSGIKLCNISSNNLNENQLVSNEKLSDFSLRVITMWMTTFVLLLLFSFLFSLDKNNDENFLNAIENVTLPIQSYEI